MEGIVLGSKLELLDSYLNGMFYDLRQSEDPTEQMIKLREIKGYLNALVLVEVISLNQCNYLFLQCTEYVDKDLIENRGKCRKIKFCKELFAIARNTDLFQYSDYKPFEFNIDSILKESDNPKLYEIIQSYLNFIIKSTNGYYFFECTNDIGCSFRHDIGEIQALPYIEKALKIANVFCYTGRIKTHQYISPNTKITKMNFSRFNEYLDKSGEFTRDFNPEEFDKIFETLQFYKIEGNIK